MSLLLNDVERNAECNVNSVNEFVALVCAVLEMREIPGEDRPPTP